MKNLPQITIIDQTIVEIVEELFPQNGVVQLIYGEIVEVEIEYLYKKEIKDCWLIHENQG